MTTHELLGLELDATADVSTLRHVARSAARLLGLDEVAATRVATSVSEIGRGAQRHGPVRLEVQVVTSTPTAMSLVIVFRYARAGADLQTEVHIAAARLMDRIDVTDDSVVVAKALPVPVDDDRLTAIRDELLRSTAADPRAVVQGLNDELITTLTALREREAELMQLNAELDQTNRGVVALYAELEQRAAEVRNAQRVVFEELESALRPPPPQIAGLELDVRYVPAQTNSPTGGDLYDWFVLPDGTVQITVVDVLGHGVAGTRDALQVTHTIRTLSVEGHPLTQLFARADAILGAGATPVVATALIARVDVAAGTVTLAGAGHPPALRIPANAAASYVEAPGHPIGYDGAGSGQAAVIGLEAGECLLLYTDGLIEVRRDLVEGMDTLAGVASAARDMRLPRLLDNVLSGCARGGQFNDDTLLLGLRWTVQ